MFRHTLSALSLLLVSLLQTAIAAEPDFALIRTYAQLAHDTYLPAAELDIQLNRQGQSLVHQAIIEASQVSYFLSTADGVQTIAVRGTANLTNAMVDLDIELQPDEQLGIILHNGFRSGALAVANDVQPWLQPDQPIHITGHSLGGAIAVILTMYLQQEGFSVEQVITFGQPKVTNVTGANRYADMPLTRVVTLKDMVPLVPPISPLQIKDLDIYWHLGEEIILLGDQQYSRTQGLKSMLRATKFATSVPGEENLTAHRMTTYLTLIDGLLTTAEEVPYQMKINLFGLSLN